MCVCMCVLCADEGLEVGEEREEEEEAAPVAEAGLLLFFPRRARKGLCVCGCVGGCV